MFLVFIFCIFIVFIVFIVDVKNEMDLFIVLYGKSDLQDSYYFYYACLISKMLCIC